MKGCQKMKKILFLVVSAMLLFNVSVFAEGSSEKSLSSHDLLQEQQIKDIISNDKDARKQLFNKINNDSDFSITSNDGEGTFSYIPSHPIKTNDEFNRIMGKINGYKAQADQLVSNTQDTTTGAGGLLRISFQEHVTDNDPWVGQETATVSSGSGYDYYCGGANASGCGASSSGSPIYWNSLTQNKDVLTFNYAYVSSVSGSVSASPSFGWTITNTSAAYTITWPDQGANQNLFSKNYGSYSITTDNVTGYNHNSSALANFSGYSCAGNAYTSVTIN
jgi:hypothetical protein